MKKSLFLFTFIGISLIVNGQIKTTVEQILDNPGRLDGDRVEITGLITQYTPSTASTTANYLLKGDYGGIIKVNTDSRPVINKKYKVTGTVVIDQVNRQAFIVEAKKSEINTMDALMIILIIGVLLLIILVVLYYLSVRKGSILSQKPKVPKFKRGNYKTVKIHNRNPKTAKILPGKLEIISGEDTGKQFALLGQPGPDGITIKIGREDSDKSYGYNADIELVDKSNTTSRRQAEIISINGRLYLKNLAGYDKNPTQVNGRELNLDERIEILPNATIKAGYIEFKYIV